VSRLAVVLFNLGGPDCPDAVRPFLFNLFRDPAILGLPALVRYPLAALIAGGRAKAARANYALLGGGSPLLPETRAQAQALEAELTGRTQAEVRVFIAMRYWKPLARETARQVAAFEPNDIVLLPLYPQYSSTTTASSLKDWSRAYRGAGRSHVIESYPTDAGLVSAHVDAIRETWAAAGSPQGLRLLFSAHGLPQKIVDAGDPYRTQVEATAAAIAGQLPEFTDWQVCFQSRVGPLKWLEPSTDAEIRRAGAQGKGVLVSPIAFVSEHVETLVELDHDYARMARTVGATPYLRAPTPGVRPVFIASLAARVLTAAAGG
jgi:ferrochelatase